MVTFDQNGVATPASQAFVQEKVNQIVNNARIDPYEKESMLRDLYNQYDLKFGTFERKSQFHQSYKRDTPTSYKSDSSYSGIAIFAVVFLILFLYFGSDLNNVLKYHFDIDMIKAIERFFQMLF